MKKWMKVILLVMLTSCISDIQIEEIIETSIMPTQTPRSTPTLSGEAAVFQSHVNHYKSHVRECQDVYWHDNSDIALSLWAELQNNSGRLDDDSFMEVYGWMLDDIETYCTQHAIDDPIFALEGLNRLFILADEEYYQFQRQARYGLQIEDMDIIETAYVRYGRAAGYMAEAAHYYKELFEIYK